jgi:Domain of unknown function (DUF1906)
MERGCQTAPIRLARGLGAFFYKLLAVRLAITLLLGALALTVPPARAQQNYLGFDKNGYPGDALLPALHRRFAYSGFWLNNPPGRSSNPWAGKRQAVRAAGFGFLILFNGRLDRELKRSDPAALGRADAASAARAARREGFPAHAILFLDLEEGGRMLPEQLAYIAAWIAGVERLGFRPGVYCSGIDVPDGHATISTARDLAARWPDLPLWVANDQCPPAPGCLAPTGIQTGSHVGSSANSPTGSQPALQAGSEPSSHAGSGLARALVWQFAQSPRRPQYTAACAATYAPDGNCYAPGLPPSDATFLDLNSSSSPDPSHGR